MSRFKSFERRLARVAAIVRAWSAEAEREEGLHKARKAVASLIREGLERAGIDPAEAVSLHRYEALEPPPPRAMPRPLRVDPREPFFTEMRTLAERMRGEPPSLATASPAMLLAYYCFGDGAREAPA